MNKSRYNELMVSGGALTLAEIWAGWHFCVNWDGLLIGPDSPEKESCTCKPFEWEASLKAAGCRASLPLSLSFTIPMALAELDKLRDIVKRSRRYVESDVLMMEDISRFAPLSPEDQAKHDTTEFPSEVLLRDIDALGLT